MDRRRVMRTTTYDLSAKGRYKLLLVFFSVVFLAYFFAINRRPVRFDRTEPVFPETYELCDNDLTKAYPVEAYAAVVERINWGNENTFDWRRRGEAKRSTFALSHVPSANESAAPIFSGRFFPWSTNKKKFSYSGCAAKFVCPSIQWFGPEDRKIPLCRTKIYGGYSGAQEDIGKCVVFSVGNHETYDFETHVIERTDCDVHVFDCDAKGVEHVWWRTHHVCPEKTSYERLIDAADGKTPDYVRVNLRGWEWRFVFEMVRSPRAPAQIHVNFRTNGLPWTYGELSNESVLAFFNALFYRYGYLVAERRDDASCGYCSEILLVKVVCWKKE